jgi:hypothetical protein
VDKELARDRPRRPAAQRRQRLHRSKALVSRSYRGFFLKKIDFYETAGFQFDDAIRISISQIE